MSNYRQYVSDLNKLIANRNAADLPRVLIALGENDYFVEGSAKSYRDSWLSLTAGEVVNHDASQFDQTQKDGGLQQTGLFAAATLHILKITDSRKLPALLETASSSGEGAFFCIMLMRGEIPKTISTKLKGATLLNCVPPQKNELNPFAIALARKHGIVLDSGAADQILESVGDDFAKMDNEIAKISLIFADNSNKSIKRDDLVPILGLLREDHAFKISDLLIENQFGEASLLIDGLLERGESSLAILGIISRHIRLLFFHSQPGESARNEVAGSSRLPSWLKTKYERVAKKYDQNRFIQLMAKLQNCDILLKSTPFEERLILQSFLAELQCV